MQLSPHFTLAELTATRHTEIDNTPPGDVVVALTALCQNFLEPIRAKFGPLTVSSGYRCPALNKLVGGVWTSAHCYGAAADITAASADVTTIARWVRDSSGLPFDQIIDEAAGDSRWCHVGVAYALHAAPRRQALVYRDGVYRIMG